MTNDIRDQKQGQEYQAGAGKDVNAKPEQKRDEKNANKPKGFSVEADAADVDRDKSL